MEEVLIEFEYDGKFFETHGHVPDGTNVIVYWIHNWHEYPKEREVFELSSLLGDAERIDSQIKTKKKLTAWEEFCQQKRLEGPDFSEIAGIWRKQKE